MSYYRDLREYIEALDQKGKLIRVSHPVNKDTELHPLVRLQFCGLPEEQRKAFYFDNVYDSKGKKYDIPVLIGALGASPQIYAIGMMCEVEEIGQKWEEAMRHPIEPVMVSEAPVQEVVLTGKRLVEHGGLGQFPIPISSPGWDVSAYITSPYCISKDPETGIRNMGTYRAQVKSATRTGMCMGKMFRGLANHWNKARKLGRPLEAAIVIGGAPNIGYASVSQLPTDVDEITVAGGIAGEPIELVRCQTIDVEVPAHAEIVIEGEISTTDLEPEAPFGEASGYIGQQEMGLFFTVKCITHRRKPIWQAFISQFAPSEASVLKQIACDSVLPKRLRDDLGISCVRRVAVHFDNGINRYAVLQLAKASRDEVWRALEAMPMNLPDFSKIVVAVDEDIDPQNANLVNWAITFRTQPHRDVRIVRSSAQDLMDFSAAPPSEKELLTLALARPVQMSESTCLLIDATLKWPYPPVALPKREFMERALRLWQDAGLPQLGELTEPWYGYSLGHWSDENERQANLAVKGEYYENGEAYAQRRKKVTAYDPASAD